MEFNIFMAIAISFIISVVLCPILIPFLKKMKFGQNIREEGPQAHLSKKGTPTMGGIVIVISIIITSLIFIKDFPQVLPVVIIIVAFGIVGFLDDYIKVVKKRSMGLRAWQKFLLQIIITVGIIVYILIFTDLGTQVMIPFTGGMYVDFGWLFVPMLFIFIMGTVNGVNFTDGIDGLASGVTLVVAVFFTAASIKLGAGMEGVSGAVIGSLLAFLIFNVYPARLFMGDTGSLALGGYVVAMACLMKMPIFIIVVGFIYLIEIVSVMMQVSYFKITKGKRIFKMTPIHHHFELSGWFETRISAFFTIVTFLLCLAAFVTI